MLLSQLAPVEITVGSKTSIQGPTQQLQEAVRQRLIEIANESEQSRDKVVHALIQVVDDPVAKKESLIAHRWLMAVSALRELKATEALDVLIKNINERGTNGIIISLHFRPVAAALMDIGEPAIPQLIEALSNENTYSRDEAADILAKIGKPALPKLYETLFGTKAALKGGAALALGWIGGNKARRSIERAIEIEQDGKVKQELEDALKEMRRHWGQ